ncbi:amino acid ABC transporter amino acid-binding protein [Bacillus sp. TS-2]|nr:amino acid ABC transporter amino acid-binding protein [Bacillus sp. TS-2]
MKKQYKWAKLGFTAVLSLGVLAACGTATDNEDDTTTGSDENAEQTKIVMGTSADYPPYESVDLETEEIIGFDIDIAKYITDDLGYELEIQNMDFDSLIPALQNNRVDFVMAGMTPTEERKKNIDFSDAYYAANNLLVFQSGNEWTSVDELAGKSIGVQLGSIQEEAADELAELHGFEVNKLNRIPEIIQELITGRIDAILMEDMVAVGYIDSQNLNFFPVETDEETSNAIAFAKDSEYTEEFNEVLVDMIESGKIDELIEKWFYSEE